MRNVALSLATAICFALPAIVLGQELPLTHYTPDSEINPLPSADVTTVYQDRSGYVWMTIFSSGVARYDGHKLELFSTADGLEDLGVWDLIEDGLGRLWVGSNGGLVVSEKPLAEYGPGTRVRFTSQIGSVRLAQTIIERNRLAVDSEGTMWVGTVGDGIIRYRPDGAAGVAADTLSTDISGEGANRVVRSIVARGDGSIVACVHGGELIFLSEDSDRFDILSHDQGGLDRNTNVLYESPRGTLWGGCGDGFIWRLSERAGRREVVGVSDRLVTNVSQILELPDGVLWVVSEGSGVLRMDPARGTSRVYKRPNGFLSDNVHHVARDREGNFWFAQVGGVSKLRFNYAAFENFTERSHTGEAPVLTASGVNCVLPLSNAGELTGVWVGTSDGGAVCIRDGERVATLNTDNGIRDNWINGLLFDEQARLWIGTFHGINCVSTGSAPPPPRAAERRKIQLFGGEASLAGYRRTTVYAAYGLRIPAGGRTVESLWFPAFRNLFCLVEGTWYVFRETSGLPITSFHAVAVDDAGTVWVGTEDHGLFRSVEPLTLSRIQAMDTEPVPHQLGEGTGTFGYKVHAPVFTQVWSESNGAPTNQVDKLVWKDGVLWVGTQKGLFVIEGEPPTVTTQLTSSEGLEAENVSSMAFSPTTGSLWIGTNAGLAEIDPGERTLIRAVHKQDGLVDNEIWWLGSVTAGDDGTIYFGTAKGLAVYRPSLDRQNDSIPLIQFREVAFSQDSMGNNELSIEYSALSFSNEKRVRYKTRLTGYDKDWSAPTADTRIRYTNLPAFIVPREYTFEVLAANGDGLWANTPIRFAVSVQPAWWFRWWAVLLQAALVGVGGFAVHRVRTYKLKQHARQLEQTVRERTAEISKQAQELQEKNVELEDKNQQIVRTQQQLIVQEKLASLGALTAGIAHEIKNPLNFVNNFSELSADLVDELREDLDKHKEKIDSDSMDNIDAILKDLEENVVRINEHGKRADGIVKGMLLHSRGQSGEFQDTDINALLNENFSLAFHGMRGRDNSFNVTLEKNFDESIGAIEVRPQDIGRVFLNIIDNACRATQDKMKESGNDYTPSIRLTTVAVGDKVEIRIRDNGKGMPADVREKVFNPFFTTRPTGQGTGLGLSISYDIVVQQHSGELKVESEDGEFTEFTIVLPRSASSPKPSTDTG